MKPIIILVLLVCLAGPSCSFDAPLLMEEVGRTDNGMVSTVVLDEPGDEVVFRAIVTISSAVGADAVGSKGLVAVFTIPHFGDGFAGRAYAYHVDEATGDRLDRPGLILLDDCPEGCVRTLLVTFGWEDSNQIGRGLPPGESLEVSVEAGAIYSRLQPWGENGFPGTMRIGSHDLVVELESALGVPVDDH